MVNKCILIGRLGRDPEVRHTGSGTAVANFSLAVNESYKDRSGERQQRTEWVQITAWSKLAEVCGQYLKKGQLVYIEGRLQTEQWETKEGEKRQKTVVRAETMRMLERREAEAGDGDDEVPF